MDKTITLESTINKVTTIPDSTNIEKIIESTINKISTTTDKKKVEFNKLSDSKKPNSVILPSETNIK